MIRKKTTTTATPKAGGRAQLDRETRKILSLKQEVAKNFWELGRSLCRVHDPKLYLAAGYKSFEAYLSKEVKISRSNAYQLMDLARNFSRETAIRYGKEKLLCAIDFSQATPEPDLPIDVTRYEFEGKNRSGKKVVKSFKQASSREIKRATALLSKKPKPNMFPVQEQLASAMAGLLSGKTPKFRIAPFLAKAKEKLKDLSPRPTVSVKVVKKGTDPMVDLQLSNAKASTLLTAFGLLAAAAFEAWMGSVR